MTEPAFDPRATPEDIVACYRLLLGRAPDPVGLASFRQLVEAGIPAQELARCFLNSEEFRSRDSGTASVLGDLELLPVEDFQVCVRRSDHDFAPAIRASGLYEPHLTSALRGILKPGQTFLDVGANIGVFSVLASHLVGPSGRVLSVEPHPANLQCLYRSIEANRLTNVQALPFAASDRSALVQLSNTSSNAWLVESGGGFFAQSIRLDDANLQSLDVVKMDIEGHEPMALAGMAGMLSRFRPVLFIEFNPRCLRSFGRVQPEALLNLLGRWYGRFRVLSAFGDDETFTDASQLMAYWIRRDAELTAQGGLPPGLLHFDLIATS